MFSAVEKSPSGPPSIRCCQAGISINPDTPVEKVLPFLKEFDYLLVMSVFPGFGGQKFIKEALARLRRAREYIDRNDLVTQIAVDGGVHAGNVAEVAAAGADILVMGSAFFGAENKSELIEQVAGY